MKNFREVYYQKLLDSIPVQEYDPLAPKYGESFDEWKQRYILFLKRESKE